MAEKQATVLVQEEFIQRIDAIRSGLEDFKSEFVEFKADQEQSLAGIEQHLDAIEEKVGVSADELRVEFTGEIRRVESKFDARFEHIEVKMVALADIMELVLEEVRAVGTRSPEPDAVKLEI